VFSLGCTIAELFLDGRTVMDLGQLLGYSRGEWDPAVQVHALSIQVDIGWQWATFY